MDIDALITFIEEQARQFGAITDPTNPEKSYILRNNARNGYDDDGKAYIGLIEPGEPTSGPYHDFSFTVMPGTDSLASMITICVGSLGFKDDSDLSAFPGVRRFFTRLIDSNGYCKSDFNDIETSLPKDFAKRNDIAHLKKTIADYSKVFSVCQIVQNPESEEGKRMISALLAGYAKMRNWRRNKEHDKAIDDAIQYRTPKESVNHKEEVSQLLKSRRFVVLQGAPGTGKTRLAKIIAQELASEVVFTQFHAETTYSDFVWGIRPDLKSETLAYKERTGALLDAIEKAVSTENPVVLIIDEINRANLANVLGPVFYLFEYQMPESQVSIELSPALSISNLPPNLFVIATMNTADRSLAVVDFALRRRFAWYSLPPVPIANLQDGSFFLQDFIDLEEIFEWFATSDELSLQPGQGYFIAADERQMKDRIKYELYPLIREYLQEGLLRPAKESFNSYFERRIEKSLFE